MKHKLLLFWLVLALSYPPGVNAQTVALPSRHPAKRLTPHRVHVSICESRRAYAYHRYACRGLARCRSRVGQVSLAQARDLGYAPCKICY